MYKYRKLLALLMALCMMISLVPAANMEEAVQTDPAYAVVGQDSDIEAPDEIEAPIGEVQMTLGGEEDAAANSNIEGADGIEGNDNAETVEPTDNTLAEPGDGDVSDDGAQDGDEPSLEGEEEETFDDAEMAVVANGKGPKITKQPKSFKGSFGKTASFTVKAEGTKLKYVWQYHKPGETKFKNVKDTWTVKVDKKYTNKQATMKIVLTKKDAKKKTDDRNGYVFRCKVTGKEGTTYTDEVTLGTSMIKTQPKDKKVNKNKSASFAVKVSGSGLKFAWEYHAEGEKEWQPVTKSMSSSYKKKTMKIKGTEKNNNFVFRCKVTDKYGIILYTNEVTLTVKGVSNLPATIDGVVYDMKDGVMTVIGYDGAQSKYTVQEKVNDQVVKAIGEAAFKGNTKLESIDLPDTIEVIGKQAFANCTKLSSMT